MKKKPSMNSLELYFFTFYIEGSGVWFSYQDGNECVHRSIFGLLYINFQIKNENFVFFIQNFVFGVLKISPLTRPLASLWFFQSLLKLKVIVLYKH